MLNEARNIFEYGWNIFKEKLLGIFDDPGIIIYKKDGKEIKNNSDRPAILGGNHRLYIGQTPRKTTDSDMYDESFYVGIIYKLLKTIPKSEKLEIILCGKIGEIMNLEDPDKEKLSLAEQTSLINGIILKYFEKESHRISGIVISGEDDYRVFFEELENDWENTIRHGEIEKEIDSINYANDLDVKTIAKILYRGCQNDKVFNNRISGTTPKKHSYGKDMKSKKYYALIEIAIRIREYLNGITIQSGEQRQHVYDDIIIAIINGEYDYIEGFEKLRSIILYNTEGYFYSIHFDKEKYKKETEKIDIAIEKRNRFINKYKNWILAILVGSGLTYAGYTYKSYEDNNKQKAYLEMLVDRVAKNKYIWNCLHTGYACGSFDTMESKKQYLYFAGENLVKYFRIMFVGDNYSLDEYSLKIRFIEEMLRREDYPIYQESPYYGDGLYIRFIMKILRETGGISFGGLGIDVIKPYLRYDRYVYKFKNTIDFDSSSFKEKDLKISDVDEIGRYVTQNGVEYYIGIYGNYIVAKKTWDEKGYSFKHGIDIALDYLSLQKEKTY